MCEKKKKLTCLFSFIGDTERRIVIGLRLGGSMDLHYQCFHKSKEVGKRITIPLHGGDLYIMSEEAVGYNWGKPSLHTFRHATGDVKYTTTKEDRAVHASRTEVGEKRQTEQKATSDAFFPCLEEEESSQKKKRKTQ